MDLDGLEKIVRAGGLVAAAHAGTADDFKHRVENPLVKADHQENQQAEKA